MHISINREQFQKQLELVGRISTKHVTLPVLQCVLIDASEGSSVMLRATNLELGVEAALDGEITEPGTVAVPAQTLLQSVQYMKEKQLTLRIENDVLVVEGQQSETTINTIPHEEFPSIPKVTGTAMTLSGDLFALGLRSVAFAASQSSIKPELGSVYITQQKEHTLTFVATDSFRLMEKTVPQKGVVLDDAIMVPVKNALEIVKICELESGNPSLVVNENQCAFQFESGVYVTARLTSGSFPDYKQIIPKEFETHTTVLKNDLVHIFKKTSVFLNKFMQVTMTVTDKSLTVSANNGEVGRTTESISAQTDGEELTLNFNQRYLTDVLSHITDESLTLHFAGIGRPLVIKGVNDTSLRYLVMPMNK